MKLLNEHPWDVSTTEAKEIQEQLRKWVEIRDGVGRPQKTIAGVDLGFEDGGVCRSAVAVLSWDDLSLVEHAVVRVPVTFPYVPGYLSFREIPGIITSLEALSKLPDIILCDGQGTAHPRRMGIACHLGVLTGIPTIGVAKTRFIGAFGDVPEEKGEWTPLMDRDETIGAVLRTRANCKPIFVSPGHLVTLKQAVEITMHCTPKYRLPETTRAAHHLASVSDTPLS